MCVTTLSKFERKTICKQKRGDPFPGEGKRAAKRNNDISSSALTLPKSPHPRQPFHKLKIGASIYWRSVFSKALIPLNTGSLSDFGQKVAGGFGIYEY